MLRLGITGGIGSGKTTVCRLFEHLAVPVYYADDRAKFLVNHTDKLKSELINAFGPETFLDGSYNRPYIAGIVFSDPAKLNMLNGIIHPYVLEDWAAFCREHRTQPYVIKEAAIMLESEGRHSVDRIALVYAPFGLRMERLLKRDGADPEAISARMKAQMPEEDKMKLADEIIYNDGRHSLILQVLDLHQRMRSEAQKGI